MAWLQLTDSGSAPVCVNMDNIISFSTFVYREQLYTRLLAVGQNSESLKILTVKESVEDIIKSLKSASAWS